MSDQFAGFDKKTARFFNQLGKNNDKAWFDRHRPDYDNHVMAPARDFVVAMGEKLRAKFKGIQAEPKVNKSIFRINRDTRFSKDKSPYKTHLGLWMWEGDAPRMECSGFYFHFEPPNLLLGVGIYRFSKPLLEAYRHSVDDPKTGANGS